MTVLHIGLNKVGAPKRTSRAVKGVYNEKQEYDKAVADCTEAIRRMESTR